MERLDAFRVRYGDLQDRLGNKVFRNVLLAEDEEPVNMADTPNSMEKRSILSSADAWRNTRAIRNAFAHDAFIKMVERLRKSEPRLLIWPGRTQMNY